MEREQGIHESNLVCVAVLKGVVRKFSLTLDKNMKEVRKPAMHMKGKCSKQRKQQMQRPGGGSVLGILKRQHQA